MLMNSDWYVSIRRMNRQLKRKLTVILYFYRFFFSTCECQFIRKLNVILYFYRWKSYWRKPFSSTSYKWNQAWMELQTHCLFLDLNCKRPGVSSDGNFRSCLIRRSGYGWLFLFPVGGNGNNPIYSLLSTVLSTWTEPETYFG